MKNSAEELDLAWTDSSDDEDSRAGATKVRYKITYDE